MIKKFLLVFLIILISITPLVCLALPTEPVVEASSALLFELRRGQVMYAKNPDEPLHIAVASKLMTGLIAIEKTEDNTMVTASKEAVNAEEAMLDLTVGEKYSAESLLYASMLNNSNDATIALAEAVGGTVNDFVKQMNDYAATLNMTHTVFVNPTGLYDEKQFTTASDLAKLLRHALTTSSEFEEIFSSQAKPWFDENKTKVLTNLNDMFWSYDGVDGGKIGYNDSKYQSVITTVTRRQQRLVCLLLDSPPNTMYTDSMKLFDHGFTKFGWGILVSKGQAMNDVLIDGQTVSLLAGSDVYYTYPLGDNNIQEIKFDLVDSSLKSPLYKNTLMGNAKFTLTDGTVIAVDLYPDREILPELTGYQKIKNKLMEYKEILHIIFFLAAFEVILLLRNSLQWIIRQWSSFMKKRA